MLKPNLNAYGYGLFQDHPQQQSPAMGPRLSLDLEMGRDVFFFFGSFVYFVSIVWRGLNVRCISMIYAGVYIDINTINK